MVDHAEKKVGISKRFLCDICKIIQILVDNNNDNNNDYNYDNDVPPTNHDDNHV